MLERLLPSQAEQGFAGHTAALWLFAALLLMKFAMSVNVIFNGASVATKADGIPLASYGAEAARAVVVLFGLWGISQLVLGLLGAFVLWRYRALVPPIFALLLLEQVMRRIYVVAMPLPRAGGTSGPYVNLLLLTITVLGLALSFWRSPTRP